MSEKKRVLIMGAAGRDFHNFNVIFRDDPNYQVVAFTAAQIPDIDDRKYPAELAGKYYSDGIPIYSEEDLVQLIQKENIDQVVFSYSDVSHQTVMHKAAIVNGAGADFVLLDAQKTMIESKVPVIAICAIRTGCGKSQTTRRVSEILKAAGKKTVAIRHPMPYGDLVKQKAQRFASYEDMQKHQCTIEEMEEYEPHVDMGNVVYAGVDYETILHQAEAEADVILWDGGNNDTPFYKPDLWITVLDPHRPGHELAYYPGETNFREADTLILNKIDSASPEGIDAVRENARQFNPNADFIEAASPLIVENPEVICNKRVLVVEDGPTLTHGGMKYGAGVVAAQKYGASELVDPRPWLSGSLKATFEIYPEIGNLLPAMGYGDEQVKDLEKTINAVDCDVVVIGTPIDLTRLIKVNKPCVRIQYRLQEIGNPALEDVLKKNNLI